MNGNPNFVVHDDGYYFHESVSWSEIAVGNLSFRYYPKGFTFNVKGMSVFPKSEYSLYAVLGFANTKVATYLAHIINPSISFGVNSFGNLPFVYSDRKIEQFAQDNVKLSTIDWDSFETSWDFQQHPLVRCASFSRQEMETDAKKYIQDMNYIKDAFTRWSNECYLRFTQLKSNEEELNRIFMTLRA